MRNLRNLIQILVVAAFLVLPVAAVSAQSGTAGSVYAWDGASDWPGVTSIVAPEALPETGNGAQSITCAESWLMNDPDGFYAHDCGSEAAVPGDAEPSALPETGYDEATALKEAYAQLRHDGSVAPETLPESGFDWESALREAYAQLRHDGSVAPVTLPKSGATSGLMGRDQQVILDQMVAGRGSTARVWVGSSAPRTVNLDGITGRDRQTIIDQLAASGVTVTTAQPAALPETGRSGTGADSPSDPPLLGDMTQAGGIAAQDAIGVPSDPPLLRGFGPQ